MKHKVNSYNTIFSYYVYSYVGDTGVREMQLKRKVPLSALVWRVESDGFQHSMKQMDLVMIYLPCKLRIK